MSSGQRNIRSLPHRSATRQTYSFVGAGRKTDTAGAPDTTTLAANGRMIAAIMNAVSDESSSKILGSIISRGRSVEEISSETGVPLSTTYRRIHEMADDGLVLLERAVITKDGKEYAIYRSSFSKMTVQFTPGDFWVTGTPNDGLPDITRRLWQFARTHSDASQRV